MKSYLERNTDQDLLATLFTQAPIALSMLMGRDFVIEAANSTILSLWRKEASVIGKPLLEAIPELQGQKFIDILLNVYDTGALYRGHEELAVLERNGVKENAYFDFIYAPVRGDAGNIIGVSVVATEVTDRVVSKMKLKQSQNLFKDLILDADFSTAIYIGEDMVIQLANEKMLQTWGRDEKVIGMKLAEALPELEGQPFIGLLQEVYKTGKTYQAKEDKVDLFIDGKLQTFYYNFSYKAIRNAEGEIYGILNMAVNVTDQVRARKQIEESEARIIAIMQNAPVAMSLISGDDLVIEFANRHSTKILGSNIESITGQKILDVYPQLKGQPIISEMRRALEENQQVVVREMELLDKEGHIAKYINYVFLPLNTDGGEPKLLATGYDVTKEIIAKKQLKQSEERFRQLANSMPQIVWTASPDGHLNYFNDKWYEYSGYERNVYGYEAWINILNPDHLDRTIATWTECLNTGKNYEIEFQFYDKANPEQYRWFLARAVPIKDENGNIIQWIGTTTDINEYKILQNQKDNFLGIASHELKTPLTSIKAYAQVLERMLRAQGEEKGAEMVKKMDTQVNRLTSLISDLLDVTKIQNGRMTMSDTDVDFNDMVKEVVEEMRLVSNKHEIELHLSGVAKVFADRHRIGQVIINLITNAIKYSPHADKVIVSTKVEDGCAVVTVQDFGIGITEDKKDKVFEQYYRVSGDEQHTFAGLGLGLFIASEIIRRYNGRIWVNSVLGKGSTFSFSLPLWNNQQL